jgi:hypothetical protein
MRTNTCNLTSRKGFHIFPLPLCQVKDKAGDKLKMKIFFEFFTPFFNFFIKIVEEDAEW